ncbi:MAG TPA: DUF4153 domain-containing protein [Gemmatimonadales bacterium]|jgi:hypothetical protein
MKTLPTLGVVLGAANRSARRFPLVLACGVLAAIAGIFLFNASEEEPYVRLLATATLGLPLFFALTLTGERRFGPGDARRWGLQAVGVVALALFWALWPGWPEPVQLARYVELSVSFHLLAAVLPYAGVDEQNGFWQYNKALFMRMLVAGLFAGVLYVGLAIALAALDKLFGVDVAHDAYGRLWVIIAFVFTTWFFTGGIPEDLAALEQRRDVPAGLRIFAQYVLVPIVVIYLVILTLYLGKIVIEQEWPSGWIGYLVSSVATVGILAWLLVRPLEDTEQRWVRTYTRGFYVAILPAIVMLWLAIGKRVAQYGVTERRYFMIVLSLWWAGIAIYYTLGKSRNIKVIPASLCVLGLVTFLGPWGAYRVSLASQRGRLDHLVAQYGLKPSAAQHDLPFDDRKEIAATLRYLLERGDGKAIAARFGGPAAAKPVNVESRVRSVMASLGVAYVNQWQRSDSLETLSLSSNFDTTPIRIAGFTYVLHLPGQSMGDSVEIEPGTFVSYKKEQNAFRVTTNGRSVLDIPLQPLFDRALAYRQRGDDSRVPLSVLRAEASAGSAAGELYLTHVFASKQKGRWSLTSYSGELFLRLR